MAVSKKIFIYVYLTFFSWAVGQNCDANPGEDFRLCNPGPGLTQVVYLDASDSVIDTIDVVNDDTVRCYDMLYKWNLLGDMGLVENFDSTTASNPVIEFDLNYLDASAIFQIELEIRNDDFSCANKDTLEIELFPNICPSADGGSNATRSLGCNETLTLDGRESTGDELDFLWTALNCALLTDFDDSTLVFSIPDATTDAEYLIELRVTDGLGFSDADTVSITIINDNPPIADAGDDFEACRLIKNNSNYRVQLDGTGSFDNDSEISYQWKAADANGNPYTGVNGDNPPPDNVVSINANQSVKEKPFFNHPLGDDGLGIEQDTVVYFSLRVYDDDGYCEDTDFVAVTLLADMCPIADAGDDIEKGSGCDLDVVLDHRQSLDPNSASGIIYGVDSVQISNVNIATDGGSEIIGSYWQFSHEYNQSYDWNSLQGLDGAITAYVNYDTTFATQIDEGECVREVIEKISIDTLYSFSPTSEISMDLSYGFELVLTDRFGVQRSSTDTVIVSYFYDEVPIAHAGNDTITNQSTILLDGSGSSDDDYDALNYSWKYLNSNFICFDSPSDDPVIVDADKVNPTVTFSENHRDSIHYFELKVYDTYCSKKDTVAINLKDNISPIAKANNDTSLSYHCSDVFYIYSSSSIDPDGNNDSLVYSWSVDDSLSSYLVQIGSELCDSIDIDQDGDIGDVDDIAICENGSAYSFSIDTTIFSKSGDQAISFILSVTDMAGLTDVDTVVANLIDLAPPIADAGEDVDACNYTISGSNYRIYLDGSGSVDGLGNTDGTNTLEYLWSPADTNGEAFLPDSVPANVISISTSQEDEYSPYFNYPEGLVNDTTIYFSLKVADDDGYCSDDDYVSVFIRANKCPLAIAEVDTVPGLGAIVDISNDVAVISNTCNSSIKRPPSKMKLFLNSFATSIDPETEYRDLTISWESLDGYDNLIQDTTLYENETVTDSAIAADTNKFQITLNQNCVFDTTFDSTYFVLQEDSLAYTGYYFTLPDGDVGVDTLKFKLSVSDNVNNPQTDTVYIVITDNSGNNAPVANAGTDFLTNQYKFELDGSLSYDEDWNNLTYSWKPVKTIVKHIDMDGDVPDTVDINLKIMIDDTTKAIVTCYSPYEYIYDGDTLSIDSTLCYLVALSVTDDVCTVRDTVRVTISGNLQPVAIAGDTVRLSKYESGVYRLKADNSFDVDGEIARYEWTAPDGTIYDGCCEVNVIDQALDQIDTKYSYKLKVMDNEGAISKDSVLVIFSEFSAPTSPEIFAVASHGQVLVSWDASSEETTDSLSGYKDFEGYRLYRSIDGGRSWGGEDDKIYDFDGNFVAWQPYAAFDIDNSISGLDPLSPRINLGSNSGIEYAYIDSNVIDGVEYTYTVTAYDKGLSPYFLVLDNQGMTMDTVIVDSLSHVPFTYNVDTVFYTGGVDTIIDASGNQVIDTSGCIYYVISSSGDIVNADTIWYESNPGKFVGPDSLDHYDVNGNVLRRSPNPTRGFYSLESAKGDSGEHNFITVIPGYTALDISFPDADDIEALFKSDSLNIGTGEREYFIVDRTKIVQDKIRYEIEAKQGIDAVEGMACEDPLVFGYVVEDSLGTPVATSQWLEEELNFFQKDSISGLPGSYYDSSSQTYYTPQYNIITPVGSWSSQFKGIRYKIANKIPLKISAVPDVSLDTLIWSWSSPDSFAMDSAKVFNLSFRVQPELSYTNVSSYNRRLNFDYKLEFFSEPDSGTAIDITHIDLSVSPPISIEAKMYIPFRVINTWTGKEVGFDCNDLGSFDLSPLDLDNGASDLVWTPGENLLLNNDSLKIAGSWIKAYNYNLDLSIPLSNSEKNRKEYDRNKDYEQGDTIYFKGNLWHAISPADIGVEPQSIFFDLYDDDNTRDNPWRPVYPWKGGEQLLIKPNKLFVDGDNWYSDMSKLGEKVGIADTLCLDTIKVVPNPYRASSKFNETPNSRRIRFTHLPTECLISIYTVSGEHVTTFDHKQEFDGNAWWNLRTGNNQDGPEIAPGLYIYVIEFPEEREYCIDTYDDEGDIQGSLENDYYSNDKYDNKKHVKKTKYHIGKFAVIR